MTDSWSSLEGVTFAEKFQIQTLLNEDGNSARFLTRIVGGPRPEGWLRLSLDGESAGAAGLSHPNLLEVWETGQGERGVTSMAYILMEPAEEDLASILRERPLNQLEAREALLAVANALHWLHARNLVHGKVEPANILAVGDRIKLASDTIAPSAEGGDGILTAAGDLRALGQCVHAMFTQSAEVDPEHLAALPQPFRDIVRGCCAENPKDRLTAQRVVNVLNWHSETGTPAPAPVPAAPPPEIVTAPRKEAKRLPDRIFVLAWVAIAFLIVLVARKAAGPGSAPPAVHPPAVNVPLPSTPPPAAAKKVPIVAAKNPPKPPSQSRIWRVVSYTYSHAEDAARMVGEINRKFPHLRAERFLPNDGGPYLVAIGGRMTYSEAIRLRERAISSGLPSDTFVRNYKK